MGNKTSWHQGPARNAVRRTDRSGGLAWPDGRLVYPIYFYAFQTMDIPRMLILSRHFYISFRVLCF